MSKENKRPAPKKKVAGSPASGDVRPPTEKKKTRVAKKVVAAKPPKPSRRPPNRPAESSAQELAAESVSRSVAVAEAPAPPPMPKPSVSAPPQARSTGFASFGAGIFDDDDPMPAPVTPPPPPQQQLRKPSVPQPAPMSRSAATPQPPVPRPAPAPIARETNRINPPATVIPKPTRVETAPVKHSAPLPVPTDRHDDALAPPVGEARRSGEGPRRGRGRKSRKQRLAEEAEVLAALARGGAAAPTKSETSDPFGEHDQVEISESVVEDAEGEDIPAEVVILPAENLSDEEGQLDDGGDLESESQKPGDQDFGRRRRRRRGRRGRGRGTGQPQGDSVAPTGPAGPKVEEENGDGEVDEFEDAPRGRRTIAKDEEWPVDVGVELEPGESDDDAEAESRSLTGDEDHPVERREMLINVAETEECRIAILREGRLDELFIERTSASSNVGNIYKGRVTNVEASIQAAFIDFGLPSHGFLHISDLHPMYFPDGKAETTEQVGKKTPRRHRPPIQNCLKRGQEVLVQVIKEGIGTKGPTLTSYISLPGRFLVMMPGMDQLGVSRKIEDEDIRRKIRALLEQLTLPEGIGFIVRTAGVDRPRRDLQRDLNFLVRLWRQVEKRIKTEPAPAELYKESDLVIRTIRDVYDSSLQHIKVDSPDVAQRIQEFLAIASPRSSDVVEVYEGDEPIFHKNGIEAEIDRLHSKTVPLPSGGSLVIEQTEAMVAIDVNSGRFRVTENAEETAFRVNTEAVDEIARQLRLRDLGGLIVCDLIDMGLERHRRNIERRFADALRKHKERAKILRISRFGLLEMTRQRQRPSLLKSVFRDCPRCAGSGRIKSSESVALDVMRQIRLASNRPGVARIDVRVSTMVSNDLLNRKRHQLTDIERAKNQTIQIHGVEAFGVDQVELSCSDQRGRDVHGGIVAQNREQPPNGFRPPSRFPARGARRRGGRGRGRNRNP